MSEPLLLVAVLNSLQLVPCADERFHDLADSQSYLNAGRTSYRLRLRVSLLVGTWNVCQLVVEHKIANTTMKRLTTPVSRP